MKKLTLSLAAFALSACSYSEEHAKFNPQPGPGLEWQKQSQSLERGTYEVTETITKQTLDQILEPMCRKSAGLDPRVKSGGRFVRYNEERADASIPSSMMIEEIAVGLVKSGEYDGVYSKWHKGSDGVVSKREIMGMNFKKNEYGGFYFTDMTVLSAAPNAITNFPQVPESAIFHSLYDQVISADTPSVERSIGFFIFGNGQRTKAAAEVRVIKYNDTTRIGVIGVWIPLATGIVDLACAPELAYQVVFFIENGTLTVKAESETLFTSAM